MLADLLDELPANGHLVVSSRAEPPVVLTRLMAAEQVEAIGADDLCFTTDELDELSTVLEVPAPTLAGAGGWPVLTALTATLGRTIAARYLWEEVIDGLDPRRPCPLHTLVLLGGGDQEVVTAVLGPDCDLAEPRSPSCRSLPSTNTDGTQPTPCGARPLRNRAARGGGRHAPAGRRGVADAR